MAVDTYPRFRDLSFEAMRLLYYHYFRVDAHGLEHIPQSGAGIIVANHSGQLPIDAAMVSVAAATNPFGKRNVQVLLGEWLERSGLISGMVKKMGAKIASADVVNRLLARNQLLMHFPEGVLGASKPFNQRYQLKRFRPDFIRWAVDHEVPIIPAAIIGCEEVLPTVTQWPWLANRLGLPYFPVAFPLPLPAKVHLYFGEPLNLSGPVEDDDWCREQLEVIQHKVRTLVGRGLVERDSWFN